MPTFPISRTEVHTQGGAVMHRHVTNGLCRLPVSRSSPLPYTAYHDSLNRDDLTGSGYAGYGLQNFRYLSELEAALNHGACIEMSDAYNKAHSRLIDKLKTETATLGAFFAEGRSALQMVTARATQLYGAFSALKRGDFRAFTRALNVRPLPKHRRTRWSKPKDASSLWLEYWMGWAPAVGDLYNAADVLSSMPPWGEVEATGVQALARRIVDTWPDPVDWIIIQEHSVDAKCRVKIKCKVRVTNPNLYLANQLGLVNPASVALEVLPFSWLAGWFVNLEQLIAHLTDLAGLEITDIMVTRSVKYSGLMHYGYRRYGVYENSLSHPSGVLMQRTCPSSLEAPILRVKMLDRLSITRGLTAMSLLTTLFIKKG